MFNVQFTEAVITDDVDSLLIDSVVYIIFISARSFWRLQQSDVVDYL